MNAQDIRKKFLQYQAQNGHAVIPREKLVIRDDPTTLFTSAGMQPLIRYLLGEKHPLGSPNPPKSGGTPVEDFPGLCA